MLIVCLLNRSLVEMQEMQMVNWRSNSSSSWHLLMMTSRLYSKVRNFTEACCDVDMLSIDNLYLCN
jgi:hypothetical protein